MAGCCSRNARHSSEDTCFRSLRVTVHPPPPVTEPPPPPPAAAEPLSPKPRFDARSRSKNEAWSCCRVCSMWPLGFFPKPLLLLRAVAAMAVAESGMVAFEGPCMRGDAPVRMLPSPP